MNLTMNGTTVTPATTDKDSVHWAITNEFEEVVLPTSGTFTYNIVGGTSPTDNFGATGSIGASSALGNVNFAAQTADLNISVLNMADPEDEFASYNWTLNYDMAIRADGTMYSTNDATNPILMAVSGHPGANFQTPTGSAEGTFAGFQAEGAPTAAVISYEANRTYDKWLDIGTIDYQIRGVVAAELQP
jgi:hypothetical protein